MYLINIWHVIIIWNNCLEQCILNISSNVFIVYVFSNKFIFQTNSADWKSVFYLAGAICIISCAIFAIFGSGELQPWNDDNENLDDCKKIDQLLVSRSYSVDLLEHKQRVRKSMTDWKYSIVRSKSNISNSSKSFLW